MLVKLNTPPRLRVQLAAATAARIVINTAHRMVYPFLPAISRGLGVPPETLRILLSVRGALGMAAPVFGPLIDRFGRRNAMLIGLGVFCGGLTLAGVWPNLWTLTLAVLLVIVCKFIFDPALTAYLSERVPYQRRGLVLGLVEIGWSGAFLLGVPLVGYLIDRGGWRAPFLPLAVAGALASLWLVWAVPADPATAAVHGGNGLSRWLGVARNPAVLAALVVSLLISAANEGLNVVYGHWMEQSFGLTVAQLGLTVTLIGLAELVAEGGVAALSDRMGKRQTVALGLVLSAASYFALPYAAGRLEWTLTAVFGVYLTFEFAIVASLPLISELVPEARSTVMGMAIASHAAGRMTGALLGDFLFQFPFAWNGLVYGAMTLAGIPLILWVVKERR